MLTKYQQIVASVRHLGGCWSLISENMVFSELESFLPGWFVPLGGRSLSDSSVQEYPM